MIKNKLNWKYSQPKLNDEIVLYVNHIKSTLHFITWNVENKNKFYNNEWNIEILPTVFVGPNNFEGGSQFVSCLKEKEFYWVTQKEFLLCFNVPDFEH